MSKKKAKEKSATKAARDSQAVANDPIQLLNDRVDAFQRAQEPAPERYAAFNALLREIKTLHDSKGADYEDGGEEYSNLTAAEDWGIPAWKYAMMRTNEKLNRLKAYAKGSTLQHEGARDSMIDIAVLSLIAIVLKERA